MPSFGGYEQKQLFIQESYAPHKAVATAILYSIYFLAATNLSKLAEMYEQGDLAAGYGYSSGQIRNIVDVFSSYQRYNKILLLNPRSRNLEKIVDQVSHLNHDTKISTAKLPITSIIIANTNITADYAAPKPEELALDNTFKLPLNHTASAELRSIGWGPGRPELSGTLKTQLHHIVVGTAPYYVAQLGLVLSEESKNKISTVITKTPKSTPSMRPMFVGSGRKGKTGKPRLHPETEAGDENR